jgi:hypothetical protein
MHKKTDFENMERTFQTFEKYGKNFPYSKKSLPL